MAKHIGDGDKTDFDEVRRLSYMTQLAGRTKRYNLAGTLVNALVHHHAVDGITPAEAADHVVSVLEGGEGEEASRAWLQEQIDRITAELGD